MATRQVETQPQAAEPKISDFNIPTGDEETPEAPAPAAPKTTLPPPESPDTPETEPVPAETPEEEPDYRALYQQTQAQLEAAERRTREATEVARGEELGVLKQAERDARLQEIWEQQQAMAEAIRNGDIDSYPDKLTALQQKRLSETTGQLAQQAQADANRDIWTIGQELKLDPNESPEFEYVRLYWRTATRTGNVLYYEKAAREAERVKGTVREKQTKAEMDAFRKKTQAEAQAHIAKVFRERGVNDILTPLPAGSSRGVANADQALDAFLLDPSKRAEIEQRLPPEEARKFREKLGG